MSTSLITAKRYTMDDRVQKRAIREVIQEATLRNTFTSPSTKMEVIILAMPRSIYYVKRPMQP